MSGSAFGGLKAFRNFVRKAAIRVIPKKLEPLPRWTIVRGDTVVVLSGRSAGKSGKVKRVLRRKNRVLVEGLNLVSGRQPPLARDCTEDACSWRGAALDAARMGPSGALLLPSAALLLWRRHATTAPRVPRGDAALMASPG
jgi:hypothetical protein